MTSVKGVLLSFPVVAVALGALAVGLIELGRYWGLGLLSLVLLAAPVALAVVYVGWYRQLPYEPRGVPPGARPTSLLGPTTDEPFEDPVEEADRLDQATKTGATPGEAPAAGSDTPTDARPPP